MSIDEVLLSKQKKIVLLKRGISPDSIDDYLALGGWAVYASVNHAAGVIVDEIMQSGLREAGAAGDFRPAANGRAY